MVSARIDVEPGAELSVSLAIELAAVSSRILDWYFLRWLHDSLWLVSISKNPIEEVWIGYIGRTCKNARCANSTIKS